MPMVSSTWFKQQRNESARLLTGAGLFYLRNKTMIKLLTSMAGEGFAYNYGEEVELSAAAEKRMIESGQAEAVEPKKTAKAAVKK